ncbi:hypothetical protein BGX26_000381 [Mortierella sp. AD094]|nr:hypothetical protein BGX26_000381 [Mortierella sp. AD094]
MIFNSAYLFTSSSRTEKCKLAFRSRLWFTTQNPVAPQPLGDITYHLSRLVADSDMMRPGLKAIRNADSEAVLQEKWNDLQRRFAHAKELIAYIKSWMEPERLAKWALYQREHIKTNNLVESWHKTFKRQYLGHKRDLRTDDLIFLLQGTMDIDYRTSYYRISRGLQPLTLSDAALARRAKAMALPFVDAKDMVSKPSERLKLMLQKHRAEKEEAERLAKAKVKEARQKREWEETQAQFNADLKTLFDLSKKQKKCTLLYFKETAVLLHTTVLQAKGLGSRTPAGRK